jgi:7-cyano-7-deazaguanine synthase
MTIPKSVDATVGLLFSGGIDSSILLMELLRQGHAVQPFYVDSQLAWQGEELRAALRLLQAVAQPLLRELVILSMPLADVYQNHWSITGREVPSDSTSDAAVYLPARNPLLIVKPRMYCQHLGIGKLAIACLRNNPFPDATPEFFALLETVLDTAASGHVELLRPFAKLDKQQVMDLAGECPLKLTFSCLAPENGHHCGKCNKCGERTAALAMVRSGDAISARSSGSGRIAPV